jgi:hypothetical protein
MPLLFGAAQQAQLVEEAGFNAHIFALEELERHHGVIFGIDRLIDITG